MMRTGRAGHAGFILALLFAAARINAAPTESPVGIERVVRLALPANLRAAYGTDAPVRLRLGDVQTTPRAAEYDLHYELRAPGVYDLRDFLQSADGADVVGLAPILVRGVSRLKPTDQGVLDVATPVPLPAYGGYRLARRCAISAWCLVFLVLMVWCRRKKVAVVRDAVESQVAPAAGDRFATLLQVARIGSITKAETLELELHVLSHWRGRLGLTGTPAQRAIQELRDDPQAGRLLQDVDRWLHVPPSRSEAADFDPLRWTGDAQDGREHGPDMNGGATP